jgi:hypothetical protein
MDLDLVAEPLNMTEGSVEGALSVRIEEALKGHPSTIQLFSDPELFADWLVRGPMRSLTFDAAVECLCSQVASCVNTSGASMAGLCGRYATDGAGCFEWSRSHG